MLTLSEVTTEQNITSMKYVSQIFNKLYKI
jgi:hypothetical protein